MLVIREIERHNILGLRGYRRLHGVAEHAGIGLTMRYRTSGHLKTPLGSYIALCTHVEHTCENTFPVRVT